MHDFKVTAWPDKTHYTIEAHLNRAADLYTLTPEEASELLACLKTVLEDGECGHNHVHRIESLSGNQFTLMLNVSDSCIKAYTVSKSKLRNLRIRLMGAING